MTRISGGPSLSAKDMVPTMGRHKFDFVTFRILNDRPPSPLAVVWRLHNPTASCKQSFDVRIHRVHIETYSNGSCGGLPFS